MNCQTCNKPAHKLAHCDDYWCTNCDRQVFRSRDDLKPVKAKGGKQDGPEPQLQRQVEKWLAGRGYGRRTPKKMQAHATTRWMVHLAKPEDNPILLDLLLLWHWPDDPAGHNEALELELKVKGGSLSPDQRCLVLTGCGAVAWSFEDATAAVLLWEDAVKARKGGAL